MCCSRLALSRRLSCCHPHGDTAPWLQLRLCRMTSHNLSLSPADSCHRWISSRRREITDAYCPSAYKLRVSSGSAFKLYSSFKSLSRRQSFQPSEETIARVDSSTARLTIRRRASLVPFLIFVRFGAHSMNTFSGVAVSLRITGSRLFPAH